MTESETEAYKSDVHGLMQRPAEWVGEPTPRLSPDAFEAYKQALIKLGVPDKDAATCQQVTQSLYESDNAARIRLSNEGVTLIVEEARRQQENLVATGFTAATSGDEMGVILKKAERMHRIATLPKDILTGLVNSAIDNQIVHAIRGAVSAAGIDYRVVNQRDITDGNVLPNNQVVVFQEQEPR